MKNYNLDNNNPLNEKCQHQFDEYSLTSDYGMVYCNYTCSKCNGVVSAFIGERLKPDKNDIKELMRGRKN